MNTKFNFTHNGTEYFYLDGYFDSAISEDSLSGELVFTNINIKDDVNAESFKAATIEALDIKSVHGAPNREWTEMSNEAMEFLLNE